MALRKSFYFLVCATPCWGFLLSFRVYVLPRVGVTDGCFCSSAEFSKVISSFPFPLLGLQRELHAQFLVVKDKPCCFSLPAEVLFRQNKSSMNAERQEGESSAQQRGGEVKHRAGWEGRKMKLRKPLKTSSGKRQALPWITSFLTSFHWKARIKLLHMTSLSCADTSYQTLSTCCGSRWQPISRCHGHLLSAVPEPVCWYLCILLLAWANHCS